MTEKEIIQAIRECRYMYNENNPEAINFWKEAIKICPEFVKQDIQSLRNFSKNDNMYGCSDFVFNKNYAEIFAPLELNLTIENK